MRTATLMALGGMALIGPMASAACFDVKTYGATGNGVTDDIASIQATIDHAAATVSKPVICFPAGVYRITHAIRPDVTNYITLQGAAGATIVADPNMSDPYDYTYPEAILVSRLDPNPPQPVYGTTIQSLAFQVKAGRPATDTSTGAIQLNNCIGCLVSDVTITYTGPSPSPTAQLDGIATSQGTTGMIRRVVVNGIPKAGIYLSTGTHDMVVDQCEAKNINGPIGGVGFSITASKNVTISNAYSHNNGGPGMFIVVEDSNLLDGVIVSSGRFNQNGAEGITLASVVVGNVPNRVSFQSVQALNNQTYGIWVQAGYNLTMDQVVSGDNGYGGIRVENTPIDAALTTRTSYVAITNPTVYDNGGKVQISESEINLVGVPQVAIMGGKLSSNPALLPAYGIGLYTNKFGLPCDSVVIEYTAATEGLQSPPAAALNSSGLPDQTADVVHGYYNLRGNGPPEHVFAAPAGSLYYDMVGQVQYQKLSGWGPTGWN